MSRKFWGLLLRTGEIGFIRIWRAPLVRIYRESEWLVGDRLFGGETRGPSSRPQTPSPFPYICSYAHYIGPWERIASQAARFRRMSPKLYVKPMPRLNWP